MPHHFKEAFVEYLERIEETPMRFVFRALSKNSKLLRFIKNYETAQKIASRFCVLSEELEDIFAAVSKLRAKGFKVAIDHLGESIAGTEAADKEAEMIVKLLEKISEKKYNERSAHPENVNVSVKLTSIGLDVGKVFDKKTKIIKPSPKGIALCEKNLGRILKVARETKNFVRIDMEGYSHYLIILEIFRRFHKLFPKNIGITFQAYLHVAPDDLMTITATGARIRLCKGAYKEPYYVAFQNRSKIQEAYIGLTKMLLDSSKKGLYHGIATHDDKLIKAAIEYAEKNHIPKSAFEFQMLYGVREDLALNLVKRGYNVRIYVPFGQNWLPYLLRRLAEKPNVLFLFARQILK